MAAGGIANFPDENGFVVPCFGSGLVAFWGGLVTPWGSRGASGAS